MNIYIYINTYIYKYHIYMVYFYEWSYIDMINEYHHRINILPFSYGFLGDRDFP